MRISRDFAWSWLISAGKLSDPSHCLVPNIRACTATVLREAVAYRSAYLLPSIDWTCMTSKYDWWIPKTREVHPFLFRFLVLDHLLLSLLLIVTLLTSSTLFLKFLSALS